MLKSLKINISNIPGWRTNRKIVVIESDDWGSTRMRSAETINELSGAGIKINDPYNLNDSLASGDDLTALFEVLNSVRDKNENPAVLTANAIMANPDFQKIKESNFEKYHYEIFTETLKKYPRHTNSFNLWKEGMSNKIFHPQFHGREHVNMQRWLKKLSGNDFLTRKYFDHEIFGVRDQTNTNLRESYMRALDYEEPEQFSVIKKSLVEGLKIFEALFGYRSKSFIAPSYVWNDNVEETLAGEGVKYLQGIRLQYKPVMGNKMLQQKLNYTGKENQFGQYYMVRNAFFEPSLDPTFKIEETLKRIEIAFKWRKPAIIGSHRLNYIGFINQANRDKNLIFLKLLLHTIIQKWPDVEFLTSDQLGALLINRIEPI